MQHRFYRWNLIIINYTFRDAIDFVFPYTLHGYSVYSRTEKIMK